MSKETKIKAGDTVVLEPVGNAKIYGHHEVVVVKVSKVGRKYFYVEYGDIWNLKDVKFRVSDLIQHSEYSATWVCYMDMQSYLDKNELRRLNSLLKETFDWRNNHGLSLCQLKRIELILKERVE